MSTFPKSSGSRRSLTRESSLCLLVLALSLSMAGCARTRQSRADKAGFLGDYSQLREGEGDEAQLVYINPDADFPKYDKILIESVSLYAKEGTDFSQISDETQRMLTDHFYKAIHDQLKEDYEIVTAAGPNTLRVRVAITEAEGANVGLNAITTIVPQTRLLSVLGGRAADVSWMVGEVGFEGEITDSESGERLGAAVDRRVGAKTLRGGFSKWGDVLAAFDTWAENFRKNLKNVRTPDKEE